MLLFIRDNARWLAAGFLLTLPWLGRTLDQMPGWKVARFTMPALAGACLLTAFAPHVFFLFLAIWLLRLFGQGMMTHIALTETGRWFEANRGRAISLVVPGHQVGEAVLPVSFVLVSAALGWQASWVAAALVILLVATPAVIALMRVERAPALTPGQTALEVAGRHWTRGEVLRDPVFYVLLTGILAPPFIGTTIFFHQGHLVELRGYSPLAFAGAFPLMAVTTVGVGLICGYLVDRFGALRVLPFFLAPLMIATLAAALLSGIQGVYIFMVLFGVSYGFTSTLLGALWPEVYGTRHLGSIRAVIVSAMVLSTALGPGITGLLIDRGIDLPVQLLVMAVWCLLASFLLAVAAKEVLRRQINMPEP
ncbi:major facilitator family transporter [Hyphomonas neptunium ATCC 15444]|uniref:Major facilitator family transporter n=2 Tax=Hyphomonas TaxID=85 RepID=Q0C3H5_HYPNA|nr:MULTISPECIES: MFS transporter [Hyphomonas]ABI77014.1 major facilitator family transporter [Hyphomonas neptunium ATCC 15444]KCZ96073.1 major facilitator family transporter [Hyphomonas hirschiana VP5]